MMRALRAMAMSPASCALLIGLLLMTTVAARAQVGGMLVAPTRVVFEGDTGTAALTLVNRGRQTETYRISFVQRRMTADGYFEQPDALAAEGMYADEFVLYSPRAVTLAPGQQQTIRLQLRKPNRLAQGEYRSHLLLQAVPSTGADNIELLLGTPATAAAGLTLQMKPLFGLTLPVIVRHGAVTATVRLSQLSLDTSGERPQLSMQIERDGNRSVFGNVVVDVVDPQGNEVTVGAVNGVAVYTPNQVRLLSVPLDADLNSLRGVLRVRYFDREHEERTPILAEAQLGLAGIAP